MGIIADLHVHTTASDGLYTPEKLVQYAKQKGLSAIAITDHDSISGIKEAIDAGKAIGVEIIPGVELSTLWQGKEIHVLGYFLNPDAPRIEETLEKQRNVRKLRNQMMIEKLNELGIEITLKEVEARKKDQRKDANVGRPHIAEVLVEKGIVKTINEAFDKYLGPNGLAYITPPRISPMEAVEYIHQWNGIAVLAHPGIYQRDELIPLLVEAGLDGIEYSHPDHTPEDCGKYMEIAEKYNLLLTAGSDFHGEREGGTMYHADLGTCGVTKEQLERLRQARK